MRGLGGPFMAFGSLVLVAAGVYTAMPALPPFGHGGGAMAQPSTSAPPASGTPTPSGPAERMPSNAMAANETPAPTGGMGDPAPPGPQAKIVDGTPQATGAASANEKGETTGSPTADQAEQLAKAANVTTDRIIKADNEPGNWMSYGRTYDEQRFSPLDQINKTNVAKLGVAWEMKTNTVRGLEATPIVVDGTMFFTGNWGVVHAVDARSGKELWLYDPKVPGEWARNACCDIVNRGVAVYKGRVYVASLDGRLIALDAKSGKPDWVVNTLTDRTRPYTITGAPRIANDMVLIGNGGAELGVRGYVTAYDSNTGAQKWRFFTVPGDPSKPQESPELEAALSTWSKPPAGDWWQVGGGGTAWDSIVYDPKLNMVYIGVGNASPWNPDMRSPGHGDNLYLSNIVALNADTGRMVWHYQTSPNDAWDFTAVQQIVLADLAIDGKQRRVVMQAPKNGFFYVLDAATGEFISANAYVAVNWTKGLDPKTHKPIPNPDMDYKLQPKLITPAQVGGHNWQPMTFNPQTGLMYIPVIDASALFVNDADPYLYKPGLWNTGIDFAGVAQAGLDAAKAGKTSAPARGFIRAWDPIAQKERWSVPMAGSWNGGLLSTAGGLVFGGGADGFLRAFDATSGNQLWSIDLKTGILAPPIAYSVDGQEYIAVLAGWGGAWGLANLKDPNVAAVKYGTNQGRLFVFKVGGNQQVAALTETKAPAEKPPAVTADAKTVEHGFVVFHRTCTVCHGFYAESAGVIPDVRMSSKATYDAFNDIVLGGALRANGMASFADNLSQEDVDAIKQYVLSQANVLWEKSHGAGATPASTPQN